jgi:hypothetical protein
MATVKPHPAPPGPRTPGNRSGQYRRGVQPPTPPLRPGLCGRPRAGNDTTVTRVPASPRSSTASCTCRGRRLPSDGLWLAAVPAQAGSFLFHDRFVDVPQVGAPAPLGTMLVLGVFVDSHHPHPSPGGTPTIVGDPPNGLSGQSSQRVGPRHPPVGMNSAPAARMASRRSQPTPVAGATSVPSVRDNIGHERSANAPAQQVASVSIAGRLITPVLSHGEGHQPPCAYQHSVNPAQGHQAARACLDQLSAWSPAASALSAPVCRSSHTAAKLIQSG